MPIHEYECKACGHHLEALQKLSDAPLKKCPECGKPALRKLISAAGFRLKGAGWYETDFKSGKKHNLVESGDKAAKETTKETSKETSKEVSKETPKETPKEKKTADAGGKSEKKPETKKATGNNATSL